MTRFLLCQHSLPFPPLFQRSQAAEGVDLGPDQPVVLHFPISQERIAALMTRHQASAGCRVLCAGASAVAIGAQKSGPSVGGGGDAAVHISVDVFSLTEADARLLPGEGIAADMIAASHQRARAGAGQQLHSGPGPVTLSLAIVELKKEAPADLSLLGEKPRNMVASLVANLASRGPHTSDRGERLVADVSKTAASITAAVAAYEAAAVSRAIAQAEAAATLAKAKDVNTPAPEARRLLDEVNKKAAALDSETSARVMHRVAKTSAKVARRDAARKAEAAADALGAALAADDLRGAADADADPEPRAAALRAAAAAAEAAAEGVDTPSSPPPPALHGYLQRAVRRIDALEDVAALARVLKAPAGLAGLPALMAAVKRAQDSAADRGSEPGSTLAAATRRAAQQGAIADATGACEAANDAAAAAGGKFRVMASLERLRVCLTVLERAAPSPPAAPGDGLTNLLSAEDARRVARARGLAQVNSRAPRLACSCIK